MEKLDTYQKIVLGVAAAFVAVLVLSNILPSGWIFTQAVSGLGVSGVALVDVYKRQVAPRALPALCTVSRNFTTAS